MVFFDVERKFPVKQNYLTGPFCLWDKNEGKSSTEKIKNYVEKAMKGTRKPSWRLDYVNADQI